MFGRAFYRFEKGEEKNQQFVSLIQPHRSPHISVFMPPECLGHYVVAYALVSVNIWFPGYFSVTYWG
jgi:hypothetical protein